MNLTGSGKIKFVSAHAPQYNLLFVINLDFFFFKFGEKSLELLLVLKKGFESEQILFIVAAFYNLRRISTSNIAISMSQ